MPYKLAIQGRSGEQEISNVLYYEDLADQTPVFDPQVMSILATEVWDTVGPALLPIVTGTYTAEQIEVTIVDMGNRVVSPFGVLVPISGQGTAFGEPYTHGAVLIAGFYGLPVIGALGGAVPKRSYVAIGPISEARVNADGLILYTAAERAALEDALEAQVETSEGAYRPVRMGARVAVGPTRQMAVVRAVVRDFASVRRSRMRRPSGG